MTDFVEEDQSHEAPAYKLHRVKGIVWATFFGSFLGGGLVIALNYARLKKTTAAVLAVLVSIGVTALAFYAVVVWVPDDSGAPNFLFYLPQLLAAYACASLLQGPCLREHLNRGGAFASSWMGSLIGLAALPFVLTSIFGIAVLMEPSYGELTEFGANDEIYRSGEVSQDEVKTLARILKDTGFFGSTGASVKIEAADGRYTLSFVIRDEAIEDPETADFLRKLGEIIVEEGFPTPLTIQLCDDSFQEAKSLIIGG